MDLKKLFENAVLNEETKEVIQEAFNTAIKAKEVELEESYEIKLVEAKATMLDEVSSIVEEAISEELSAISEELEHARTLEIQYADKLQTFKESYAEKQEEDLKVMVAESVAEEIEELKEDIAMAKKHEFAITMFEAYKETYERMFGGSDISVFDELEEAKKELDGLRRTQKLNELLEGLEGNKRAIAETILESVSTDKLEDRFSSIRSILLAESKKPDEAPLEEGKDGDKEIEGTVILENEEDEQPKDEPINEAATALEKKLAKSLNFIKK